MDLITEHVGCLQKSQIMWVYCPPAALAWPLAIHFQSIARLECLSLAPLTLSFFLFVCPLRLDNLNHERARIQVSQVSLTHSKYDQDSMEHLFPEIYLLLSGSCACFK